MTSRRRFPTEREAAEVAFRLNLRAEMEGWLERYVVTPMGRRWLVRARRVRLIL